MDRYYLDQAATSWPKPQPVLDAFSGFYSTCGASPGRGSYRSSLIAEEIIEQTRRSLASLIGAPKCSDIVFTSNGTQSLNLALQGIALKQSITRDATSDTARSSPPPHIVTTATEHNSVLRSLALAKQRGWIDFTIVSCDPTGIVAPEKIEEAINEQTSWLVINHASNVTGAVQDIQSCSAIAKKHGLHLMVDAAQSLGYLPVNVAELGIDILSAPTHKGLCGVVGASLLYVRKDVQLLLEPLWVGGSGQSSHQIDGPWNWTEQAEAGNVNVAAIAALQAAIEWGHSQPENDFAQWTEQIRLTSNELKKLKLVGPIKDSPGKRIPVFSFDLSDASLATNRDESRCQEWAMMLEQMAGVECRAGFHCAGAIHSFLGTQDRGGTLRLSLGHTTKQCDVDAACQGLQMLDEVLE